MLALAWEYLAGRAVAKSVTSTDEPEWPPHPDRVFQALVAAWGEHGCDEAERDALEWLESAGVPALAVPLEHDTVGEVRGDVLRGAAPTVFVPTNDVRGGRGEYSDKAVGLIPYHRKKAGRTFPSVVVGPRVCALRWDAANPGVHVASIERLASRVSYLGHSRSLVRMWVTQAPPATTWFPVPSGTPRTASLRVPTKGRLSVLIDAYAGGGQGWRRPPWATDHGYILADARSDPRRASFSSDLVILAARGMTRLGLSQTLLVTGALRGALIKCATDARVRELVSGHDLDGAPLDRSHVAYLPLAFVDRRHADGHLLGVALALPRDISPSDEQSILDVVARACRSVVRDEPALHLFMGAVGELFLETTGVDERRNALRPESWCRPSRTWRTVTPFVLDRMPPRRHDDHEAWVVAQVRDACARQGLPQPADVELDTTPFVIGAPNARSFPAIAGKDRRRKWHTHIRVRFAEAVAEPLVLGAGRYRGYGLFRPAQDVGGGGSAP